MKDKVRKLIDKYNLIPLPAEETLFCQSYKSKDSTAIIGLYCREPLSRSLFHKLTEDEVWHFYSGDPFRLILLNPDGSSEDILMGSDPLKGHHIQFVVPAGVWQAGELAEGSEYSLYGCTMAPGFREDMFTGGTAEELLSLYPDRKTDINKLSCPPDGKEMTL